MQRMHDIIYTHDEEAGPAIINQYQIAECPLGIALASETRKTDIKHI